jgi:Amidase
MIGLTARQSVDAALAKIEMLNGDIRALIYVAPDSARNQADVLDRSQTQRGPLFGTTYVAKDLIDIALQPTQAGSRLFSNQPAKHDASCVAPLKAEVLGKANMHELAVDGAINPWFGQVINPLSADHGTAEPAAVRRLPLRRACVILHLARFWRLKPFGCCSNWRLWLQAHQLLDWSRWHSADRTEHVLLALIVGAQV